jgi:heme/copper-type cytochrome/quinol oxidase subunit 3
MTDTALRPHSLAVGSVGRKAFGWWGMVTIVMTEGALFGYLLFSYYYFALQYGREWLPEELPKFRLSAPNTIILLMSSLAMWWGERGIRHGARGRLALGLAVALALGAVFIGVQGLEWHDKPFTLASSSYGSLYFTLTGFHMAHVIAGGIILAVLLVWTLLGTFDRERHAAVSVGSLYWHFVDVVWLTLFFTIYVTPRLGW